MTSKDFFIYGSFSEGQIHFGKIENYIHSTCDAHILGSCYRTPIGFPIVFDEGCDQIPGQLIHLEISTVVEAFLDELHGYNPQDLTKSLTHKKSVLVHKNSDESVYAEVYFLNPAKKTKALTPIIGGDWRESLRQNPALPLKLTDRQKTYVTKLGASTGRDIVPIDLVMYRELMNLELIVDKGRRLALSKLGQEVYGYL